MNCTFPGCKGRIHGRGRLCPAHQRQKWLRQELRPVKHIRTDPSPMSRITGRYEVTDAGCWKWTGLINRAGYGYLSFGRRKHMAHRFVYEQLVGPIPDGMILCHKCDNPPCVNPEHLFLGTDAMNAKDKSAKGRHPRNKATTCKHGHVYTPETMYYAIDKRTGRRFRRCRLCSRNKARSGGPRSPISRTQVPSRRCSQCGPSPATSVHPAMPWEAQRRASRSVATGAAH